MFLDDFLWRAVLGGLGVALVAGPIGCFVVWRRMAYFGATLSHAALLGIALGLFLDVSLFLGIVAVCIGVSLALLVMERRPELTSDTVLGIALGLFLDVSLFLGIVAVCIGVSLALLVMERRPELNSDTVLGILSHASLALGLVVLSFQSQVRVDLLAYLFGDILSVRVSDLAWIWGGAAACLIAMAVLWRGLLALTVDEDLARVEGIAVERQRLAFLLLVSVVVALSMQVVGLLLTVSLLIIPAATARRIAGSPESMALWAAVVGAVAVLAGLQASLALDTPAGPSIVVAASALFAVTSLISVRT